MTHTPGSSLVTERLRSIAAGAKSLWPASAPEIRNAADEIDILRNQNAALLEACEVTLGYNSTGGIKNGLPQKLIDQIRAAIALAKGEGNGIR